eukprot:CFRG0789T1
MSKSDNGKDRKAMCLYCEKQMGGQRKTCRNHLLGCEKFGDCCIAEHDGRTASEVVSQLDQENDRKTKRSPGSIAGGGSTGSVSSVSHGSMLAITTYPHNGTGDENTLNLQQPYTPTPITVENSVARLKVKSDSLLDGLTSSHPSIADIENLLDQAISLKQSQLGEGRLVHASSPKPKKRRKVGEPALSNSTEMDVDGTNQDHLNNVSSSYPAFHTQIPNASTLTANISEPSYTYSQNVEGINNSSISNTQISNSQIPSAPITNTQPVTEQSPFALPAPPHVSAHVNTQPLTHMQSSEQPPLHNQEELNAHTQSFTTLESHRIIHQSHLPQNSDLPQEQYTHDHSNFQHQMQPQLQQQMQPQLQQQMHDQMDQPMHTQQQPPSIAQQMHSQQQQQSIAHPSQELLGLDDHNQSHEPTDSLPDANGSCSETSHSGVHPEESLSPSSNTLSLPAPVQPQSITGSTQ